MTTVKHRTRSIDGSRHYEVEVGGVVHLVPSVNTLKGLLASPALEGWKINRHIATAIEHAGAIASMKPDAAKRFVRAEVRSDTFAIEYGNEVHLVAEAVLLGDTMPITVVLTADEADAVARNVEQFVSEFEVEPILVEQAVIRIDHDEPIYAGTLDLLAKTTLGNLVIDWKSGASGIWSDAALTTGGYAAATHVLTPDGLDTMPPVNGAAAVWLRPEGWALHPLDISDAHEALRMLAALQRWQQASRVGVAVNRVPLKKAVTR